MTPTSPDSPLRRRRIKPVAAFSPALIDLLVSGANSRQEIPNSGTNAAEIRAQWKRLYTLRTRLHELRAAMRREKHPMLSVVERTVISIQPRPSPEPLVLHPRDSEFDDLLAARKGESAKPTVHSADDFNFLEEEN